MAEATQPPGKAPAPNPFDHRSAGRWQPTGFAEADIPPELVGQIPLASYRRSDT